jgi:carbonic anhydrase
MQKKRYLVLAVLALFALNASCLWAKSAGPGVTPDEAVKMLKEGNDRYAGGTVTHPNQDPQRRGATASMGQQPFATVISCSDSRVPVEILFDAGVGDVFVIRVAGNVADVDETGSIEYGVDHLGTPLLVVLGHTKCGAVTAVVQKAELHGNIVPLVDNIIPAVAKAQAQNPNLSGDALIPKAIEANVWQVIEDIFKNSHTVRDSAKAGHVKVLGAMYDIESGKVEWMGPHPNQDALLAK